MWRGYSWPRRSMHHSSAEIGLDSSTSVPKVASFEDEGGDKFVELIDVEGSVHSGGELGGMVWSTLVIVPVILKAKVCR